MLCVFIFGFLNIRKSNSKTAYDVSNRNLKLTSTIHDIVIGQFNIDYIFLLRQNKYVFSKYFLLMQLHSTM